MNVVNEVQNTGAGLGDDLIRHVSALEQAQMAAKQDRARWGPGTAKQNVSSGVGSREIPTHAHRYGLEYMSTQCLCTADCALDDSLAEITHFSGLTGVGQKHRHWG